MNTVRILLVEDSPSDALLLQEAVNTAALGSFEFRLAESLADAFALLREQNFDAMLLDLSLPDSHGRDTFLRVRRAMPQLPIVVLTGAESEAIGLEAVRHGIQDYLMKGQTDGAAVARAIRYAIERKRVEDALQQSQRELEQAQQQLELRVQERTRQLAVTNEALQAEIVQRQRAEQAHAHVLRKLDTAQETERARISRELHDQLGQDLTALRLGLSFISKQGSISPQVDSTLRQLSDLSDTLMRNLHRLAWQLRPVILEDFGIFSALERYTKEWSEQTGVGVDFHTQSVEETRFPAEIESTLYRVTQEALTNVARHAQARRVSVLLEARGGWISLIVEDDGKGFDLSTGCQPPSAAGKLGLLGMQERVSIVGGKIEFESAPGQGTAIFVRIPLHQIPAATEQV